MRSLTKWLESYNATEIRFTASGDWLAFRALPSQIEALFETCLVGFERGAERVIRANKRYSVPYVLKEHIAFVGGLHRLPGPSMRAFKALSHYEEGAVTPKVPAVINRVK